MTRQGKRWRKYQYFLPPLYESIHPYSSVKIRCWRDIMRWMELWEARLSSGNAAQVVMNNFARIRVGTDFLSSALGCTRFYKLSDIVDVAIIHKPCLHLHVCHYFKIEVDLGRESYKSPIKALNVLNMGVKCLCPFQWDKMAIFDVELRSCVLLEMF